MNGTVLYSFAVVLIGIWLLGFIAFNAGHFIHLFLIGAAVVLVIRILKGKELL